MVQVGDSLPELDKSVTQERIEQYAVASGDFNPVHIDEEFAATSQFGGRIAHGMLIAAFVSEMLTRAFERAWPDSGKLKIRFRAPVFPGETVSTFGEVKKIENIDGVKRVSCSVGVRKPNGEAAITGDAVVNLR